MNRAALSSGRQELGKGALKVILDEGGDTFFFTVGNNEEMSSAGLSPIVNPARSWKYIWLQV